MKVQLTPKQRLDIERFDLNRHRFAYMVSRSMFKQASDKKCPRAYTHALQRVNAAREALLESTRAVHSMLTGIGATNA